MKPLRIANSLEPMKYVSLLGQAALYIAPSGTDAGGDGMSDRANAYALVAEHLKLPTGPFPKDVAIKVHRFLFTEISRLVFQIADRDEILARLGDKGILPRIDYEVFVPHERRAHLSSLGVKVETVKTAVMVADAYEHFHAAGGGHAASVFVKHFDRFTILALGMRSGRKVTIGFAFRLSHRRLTLDPSMSPREVIQEFANEYGIPFTFDGEETKVVFEQSVTADEKGDTTLFSIKPGERSVEAVQLVSRTASGAFVGVSFAIDVERYRNDL